MPDSNTGDDQIREPKQDRIGSDYREGPNPQPGGVIDTGDALVPPYEGRLGAEGDPERAESVRRAMAGDETLQEPQQPSSPAEGEQEGEMAPEGVGSSVGRRGEDAARRDGKESGRQDTGREGQADRPTGTSSSRDKSGVGDHDD
jgi:hypothetical protein